MTAIKQLKVFINLGEQKIPLGELISDNQRIYFKYYPEFIKTGIQISPFKLPLSPEIQSEDSGIFDGLHGVFNDSLPDGWGRLLIDRELISQGHSLSAISPLDRLSFLDSNGMGALSYQPIKELKPKTNHQLDLDFIAKETQVILKGDSSEIIEELVILGGSSGGARPKIFIGYDPEKDHIIHGTQNMPSSYEHWIIKFPSSTDLKDIAQIEYAYHKMAIDAGIEMSECKLFEGATGKAYFGTKRFDRIGNQKIHLHSASGLMHDNFRLSNMDYGHLMDAAFRLENHVNSYRKILRLAAFNVFSHNRDDHSKNFAFLMDLNGKWKLAPAYDLTFSFSSHGYHSTTIGGEGQFPGNKQLLSLAKTFGIKDPSLILQEVKDTINNWNSYAKDNGVSTTSMNQISKELQRVNNN